MIGRDDWPFTQVRAKETETGQRMTAVYGWTTNEGSTDEALHRILQDFKQVHPRPLREDHDNNNSGNESVFSFLRQLTI